MCIQNIVLKIRLHFLIIYEIVHIILATNIYVHLTSLYLFTFILLQEIIDICDDVLHRRHISSHCIPERVLLSLLRFLLFRSNSFSIIFVGFYAQMMSACSRRQNYCICYVHGIFCALNIQLDTATFHNVLTGLCPAI